MMVIVTEQKEGAVEVDRVELEDGGFIQLMSDNSFNLRGLKQINFIADVHVTYAKLHEADDTKGFYDLFKKLHALHGDNGLLYAIALFGMEQAMENVTETRGVQQLINKLMSSEDGK